jgi:hypothetical protein
MTPKIIVPNKISFAQRNAYSITHSYDFLKQANPISWENKTGKIICLCGFGGID